ncbi:MAG: MFS transporter [Actinobacteria bacterium HGW-Actinobacteria-7]|nr:MAG: MFS transporter [Actinobacteria bacterium HGW-Actinobacteria-7]
MPAHSRRLVLLLGFAGFIVMADNWVVSPILPAISKSVGVTPEAAGLLIAAYMLPFGVFQLVFGPLADRFGKSRVILSTFTAFAVATALCALGNSLTGIAAFRALTGLFAAATMPISLALIADTVPMEQRQQAVGSFMGIAFLGQALSMGIGGAIAYYFDWRGVFIVYALAAVVIAVALWRGLRGMDIEPPQRDRHESVFKPYLALLGHGPSLRTYLIILVEGAFLLGSFSYLGALLAHRFSLSFLAIGGVLTAFGVAAIIAGRTSSKLAGAWGRTRTIAAGIAVAAFADGLVFAGGHSLILTGIGVFALGFGFMTAHSTLITVATEFAARSRGTAMSLVTFAFMVGGAIGTQAGGRIAQATALTSLYGIYATGLLALALVALFAVGSVGAPKIAALDGAR